MNVKTRLGGFSVTIKTEKLLTTIINIKLSIHCKIKRL